MQTTQKEKQMNNKNQQKKKEIDWMITLVPLALIVGLLGMSKKGMSKKVCK